MNHQLKRTWGVVIVAMTCVSGIAMAQARVSAAACFTETDYAGDYFWKDGIANNSNGPGWRPRKVYCPVSDSIEHPRTSLRSVQVSVVDGNNQFGSVHNFKGRVCMSPAASSTTELAPICSREVELNEGTTTGTRELLLPDVGAADPLPMLRSAPWWFPATLIITIPAHNGWPSVLRGYEFFY